jgi:hypothetical protein
MAYPGVDETKDMVVITDGVAGLVGEAAAGMCSILTPKSLVRQYSST